jgi:small-conductance mechanosensitive channel
MDLTWIADFWARYVPAWAVALLGMATAVLIALVIHGAAFRVINRLVQRRWAASTAAAFLRRIRWPTRFIILAFAITAILPGLPVAPELVLLIQRVAALALIAMAGWMAISLVNLGGDLVTRRYDMTVRDNYTARRVRTQLSILLRTVNMVLIVITVSIMLMTIPGVREFGVSLFASAGLAGIAVGLAAKPTLSNLIAGLQIALAQPIRLDDVVIVEGEWGRIEQIYSTYVQVRLWDERRLVVPLTQFIEKPFQNWTRRDSPLIGTVFWRLDYTAPVELMRKKLDEFVRESKHWDGKTAVIQVTDADGETIEVRALVSAAESGSSFDLRCEVREKMIVFLNDQHPYCLPRRREEQIQKGVPANGNGANGAVRAAE